MAELCRICNKPIEGQPQAIYFLRPVCTPCYNVANKMIQESR